jgi:serine protease AprX
MMSECANLKILLAYNKSTFMKTILLCLSILFSSFLTAQNKMERAFLQKAKPDLVRDFKDGKNEFWIVFTEQADVSSAYQLNTKEEKGEYVFKILTETANRVQKPFIELLSKRGISFQRYWISNSIFIKGDVVLAQELSAYPEIKEMLPNTNYTVEKPIELKKEPATRDATATLAIEWGLTKIKAPDVWNMGYKGKNIVVGGQDTGYDWNHPAIKGKYRGWNGSTADHDYNWHDAVHSGNGGSCGIDSKEPCDDSQHGTHTMGIMTGDDGAGNQIGVAPDAKWIGCRNMASGVGTPTSYNECFQWFLAPTDLNGQNPMPSQAPHVINNSWGCDAKEGCNSSNYSTMETIVNNLKAAGVVVVVSSGNDGSGCNTITTPAAIFENSFVVGSTTSADAMSGFSSRGPVTVDGSNRVKPNVCAPGSSIRSCIPGTGYSSMSGTSMAGPHVAGAVAVLISAVPSLAGKVEKIETAFEKTAVHISNSENCGGTSPTTFPNNTIGFGRIDLLAAINYAISISISVQDKNSVINQVVVYPSPAEAELFAVMNDIKNVQAKIYLYNTTGQLVANHSLNMNNYTLHIPVAGLASGVYSYNIVAAGKSYKGKFVKK